MWKGFYFYGDYITFASLSYPEDTSSVLNHWAIGLGNKGSGLCKGYIEP